MHQPVISLLQRNKVIFQSGLSIDEVKKIENTYHISLPTSVKSLFMAALPITQGFYRWRDFSTENVAYIQSIINFPYEDVYEHATDVEWFDGWGNEPHSQEEYIKTVRQRLKNAPKLIPIFSHRYVPSLLNSDDPPVISFHSADDLIYYGSNLLEYFAIEFGQQSLSSIDFARIVPIPFWSEIM